MDYSPDNGSKFAIAGKSPDIEIYDDKTMQICVDFKHLGNASHTNSIFSVKFDPNDPNLLYSGGWDCSVFLWDLRIATQVHNIYGPQISGDCLDVSETQILTGGH